MDNRALSPDKGPSDTRLLYLEGYTPPLLQKVAKQGKGSMFLNMLKNRRNLQVVQWRRRGLFEH
eukprot:496221-Amphidinium_carterae.1